MKAFFLILALLLILKCTDSPTSSEVITGKHAYLHSVCTENGIRYLGIAFRKDKVEELGENPNYRRWPPDWNKIIPAKLKEAGDYFILKLEITNVVGKLTFTLLKGEKWINIDQYNSGGVWGNEGIGHVVIYSNGSIWNHDTTELLW